MDNEIVFADDAPRATISDRVRRGTLRRLASGVYTSDLDAKPEDIIRRNIHTIVGRLLPDSVITDRSAKSGNPVNGVLYVARPGRAREINLPGVLIKARTGAAPLPTDIALPGGAHIASKARALAENSVPSRARAGERRTLDDVELGDWVDFLCHTEGEKRLAEWRQEAEALAPELSIDAKHLDRVRSAIGVAIGTRDAKQTPSRNLASRRAGRPVDQSRVKRFEELARALQSSAPQNRPEPGRPGALGPGRHLPFYEAYFSNYIEGTEFTLDEARQIVFENKVPAERSADAHDVLGTHMLLADTEGMNRTGADADEFIELVKSRNATIMNGRPDMNPGIFKTLSNRAGDTYFVEPEFVEGTLRAGFRYRDDLDTPWERATYTSFMVAEVHPFADGNGRTARAMMDAELSSNKQCRIIIPTVFRHDYLDGLRGLSRRDDPTIFIKVMRYAHDFTASIDFSNDADAEAMLREANAFNEPDSAQRLRILSRSSTWQTQDASRSSGGTLERGITGTGTNRGSFRHRDHSESERSLE